MSLILFIIGLLLAIFSHPRVMRFIMHRLFNTGLVPPQSRNPEKTELIKGAGPGLSLFTVGVVLMILGILIRSS